MPACGAGRILAGRTMELRPGAGCTVHWAGTFLEAFLPTSNQDWCCALGAGNRWHQPQEVIPGKGLPLPVVLLLLSIQQLHSEGLLSAVMYGLARCVVRPVLPVVPACAELQLDYKLVDQSSRGQMSPEAVQAHRHEHVQAVHASVEELHGGIDNLGKCASRNPSAHTWGLHATNAEPKAVSMLWLAACEPR